MKLFPLNIIKIVPQHVCTFNVIYYSVFKLESPNASSEINQNEITKSLFQITDKMNDPFGV